jgi:hypothetical protein
MPPKKNIDEYNLTELSKADQGLQWLFLIGELSTKYKNITDMTFTDLSQAFETLVPKMFLSTVEANTYLDEQMRIVIDKQKDKQSKSLAAGKMEEKQGPKIKQLIDKGREFIKYVSFLFEYAYHHGEGLTYAHRIKSIMEASSEAVMNQFKTFAMTDSIIINNYFEKLRGTINTVPPGYLSDKLRLSHAMIFSTLGSMLGNDVEEFERIHDTVVQYYDHPDTTTVKFLENADGTIATGASGERILHVTINVEPETPGTPPPPPPPPDAAVSESTSPPRLLPQAATQAASPPGLLSPEAVRAAAAQADAPPGIKPEEGLPEIIMRALGLNTATDDDWVMPPKDRSKISLTGPKYQLRGLESNLSGHKINLTLPKISLHNKINLLL